MKTRIAGIALAALALAASSACQNWILGGSKARSLSVAWAMSSSESRTIVPANCPTPSTYEVTLASASGGPITQSGLKATSWTFNKLGATIYSIAVNGMDGSGNVIVAGTGSADLTSAASQSPKIVLKYISSGTGTGSISLAFDASGSGLTVASTAFTLLGPSGNAIVDGASLSGASPSFSYSLSLAPAGSYKMFAKFVSGNKVATRADSILVLKGIATACTIGLGSSDFNEAYVAVSSLSLSKATMNLVLGGATGSLKAVFSPANASNVLVSWSSSDPGVASVDQGGVVTAKALGQATIKASSAENPTACASCGVRVVDTSVPATGVSLNKASTSLAVGASETLIATVTPSDATNQNVSWTSSNSSVAAVDDTGAVKGIAAGTATIRAVAEDGGWSASCAVTVMAQVGGTVIGVQSPYLVDIALSGLDSVLRKGSTMTVTATPDKGVDSYAWYVDGVISPNATSTSITLSGDALSLDRHSLMVVAAKGGQLFSASRYFTVAEKGTTISVTVQGGATVELSLSGQATTISQGKSMTVWAYANGSVDSYAWYLDGAVAASSTGSSYTTPTDLGLGRHTLAVVAAKGASLYSASCYFTVIAGSTGIAIQNPDIATVSLSGLPATIAFGATATVYAYSSSMASSYTWYLDGSPIAGQSSSSVAIGSGLGRGRHCLMIAVSVGNNLFTASGYFSVQ